MLINYMAKCLFAGTGILLITIIINSCAYRPIILSNEQRAVVDKLEPIVSSYLLEKFSGSKMNGKTFCSYDVLGLENNNTQLKEFIVANCQEYYLEADKLNEGSGSNLPIALTIQPQENSFRIINHELPRDGSMFSSDLEKIFPQSTQDRLFALLKNHDELSRQNLQKANKYFQNLLAK